MILQIVFEKYPYELFLHQHHCSQTCLLYTSPSPRDVEVEFEDNLLTVRTKQVNKSEDSDVNGEIIHKGISQRQFARSFTIADDVKVNGAELKDGLLTISCERIIPEHKKKKLIEIK